MTTVHYFAFGSNMSSSRFLARVPKAESVGRGVLPGWRFTCDKGGFDGSAKANIVEDERAEVWGVVFAMPRADLPRLDRIEGGYERIEVEVSCRRDSLGCFCYASTLRVDGAVPFDWYKGHIVNGAEEFALPEPYLAMLRALPHRSPGI